MKLANADFVGLGDLVVELSSAWRRVALVPVSFPMEATHARCGPVLGSR